MSNLLFVPAILFMVIVAPIWIVMHYTSKNKAMKGLSEEDKAALNDIIKGVDQLEDRIHSLERILDEQQPNWRRSNSSEGM